MKIRVLLILCCLILTACQAAYPVIIPGQTQIEATILDDAYQPRQWRVSAGKEISLKIKNESKVAHAWILLSAPYTEPFDQDDQAATIIHLQVQPGETKDATFLAPAAPGKYDVVSDAHGDVKAGMIGHLIAVQDQE
jgi:plastocyanin